MDDTYARDWKPINHCGSIHYDPRDELACRARQARDRNEPWVAIPVKLAAKVAELRECGATTTLRADEDGPLDPPVIIRCRKPEGHDYDHYNGYCSWAA